MASTDLALFKNVLSKSRHIIVVAGAGLSAASGAETGSKHRLGIVTLIPGHVQATPLATPEAFEENPSRVWQFYHYRREAALRAAPNAAHYALARFASPQIRESRCLPNSTFTLITQNVDGISPTALREVSCSISIPKETDERPHIIEMHGKLHDIICTKCDYGAHDRSSPICQALAGTEELLESTDVETDIALKDLPCCGVCGALARPGVVWFGEQPHHLDLIDNLVEEADLCLVVGTSSTVYPAAGYALMVQHYGGKVAVFNLERTDGDEDADFLFLGPCEQTLPEALGL